MNANASYFKVIGDAARDAIEAEAKAARAHREKTNRGEQAAAAAIKRIDAIDAPAFVKQPAQEAAAIAHAIAVDINRAAMVRMMAAEEARTE